MTDISNIFSISSCVPHKISLCGYLEAIIGKYFLSQSGNPEAYWYAIYYDSSIDEHNECVEIIDENLIGYVYYDNRVAFVLNSFLEKFINDTLDYNIYYVGVDSLDKECLECRRHSDYSTQILPACWIDDDFLNNGNISFDYEKFKLIDEGVKYLNPKHFSVKNFVKYCRLDEE
ncbi:transposase [Erysipelotrichaceae bacterium HCN-30851]